MKSNEQEDFVCFVSRKSTGAVREAERGGNTAGG
jgi:hypothetical protein